MDAGYARGMDDPLKTIASRLEAFAQERDWDGFHSPKNLAMALNVEAGELLEHFQWLTEDQSRDLPQDTRVEVEREIADIQIYLIRLADKLGVDLLRAVEAKIEDNARKYPAERVRGSAKKYTEYTDSSS
jgi:dCTP diphosphatase